jgi:predicted outer membrane repeat protein
MSRRLSLTLMIATVVGLAIAAPTATATRGPMTLYVNGRAGTDTPSCGAPAAPCKTIGQAITNAQSADTIDVAAGTYAEHVVIGKQLTLSGAGEERTIVAATMSHRAVVTVAAHGVILSRLTVTGAMLARGIFNQAGAALTLVDTTVRDNGGGGIDNQLGAKLSVRSSTIRNNVASRGGSGGGITNAGQLRVTDSSVNTNTATTAGGGIFSSGEVTVHNSTVNFNSARTGGAISVSGGSLKLDHSTGDDNKATDTGGALFVGSGSAQLSHSELLRNQAGNTGGAIYASDGTVVVLHHTRVQGNSTPQCVPTSLC